MWEQEGLQVVLAAKLVFVPTELFVLVHFLEPWISAGSTPRLYVPAEFIYASTSTSVQKESICSLKGFPIKNIKYQTEPLHLSG